MACNDGDCFIGNDKKCVDSSKSNNKLIKLNEPFILLSLTTYEEELDESVEIINSYKQHTFEIDLKQLNVNVFYFSKSK